MLQKSDLARMYRLFQRIPKGLEPVAESFRKHVEGEGMKLVKEATEAATAKKDKDVGKPSKDSGLFALSPRIAIIIIIPHCSPELALCFSFFPSLDAMQRSKNKQ